MDNLLSSGIRFYTALLRLYPSPYRKEFEEQMLLDFTDLATDAKTQGKVSLIMFFLRELFDLPISLLQVHLRKGIIYKVFRTRPINFGLRGAIGFGVAFFLTVPFSSFAYNYLSYWLNAIAMHLETFLQNIFSLEQGAGFQFFISTALSSLFTGLLFGVLLAVLFAPERSKYPQYFLAGLLGWFLYHTMGYIFSLFNFVGLTTTQFWWFNSTLMAFSGAIFGLVMTIAGSNQRAAIPWLMMGVLIYPISYYFSAKQLLNPLVFSSTGRFIGVMSLMMVLITSVFVAAIRLHKPLSFPWVVVAGTVAAPGSRLLFLAVANFFDLSVISMDLTLVSITITNGIYGILFGLFLGLGFGFQKENNFQQMVA